MFGVCIGEFSFTDFDFADDVTFLAELHDILQSALIIFNSHTGDGGYFTPSTDFVKVR